jgi:hypothetical protein
MATSTSRTPAAPLALPAPLLQKLERRTCLSASAERALAVRPVVLAPVVPLAQRNLRGLALAHLVNQALGRMPAPAHALTARPIRTAPSLARPRPLPAWLAPAGAKAPPRRHHSQVVLAAQALLDQMAALALHAPLEPSKQSLGMRRALRAALPAIQMPMRALRLPAPLHARQASEPVPRRTRCTASHNSSPWLRVAPSPS